MAGWVDGMVDIVIPGLATDSITASHSVTIATGMIDFVSDTGFSETSSYSPGYRTATTTTVISVCEPAGVGACGRSATEASDQSDA
jgi:citrate lyase beta subunit